MKMVTAIVRPEKFDAIKEALETAGIYGMTISEVRGRGAQKGISLQFRGKMMPVDLIPKLKIEMAVRSADVDTVIKIIRDNGRTGKFGDGRIFVLPIETMCKVRTDESDPADQ
jgi:nitrogen regulatory protein P-II 1